MQMTEEFVINLPLPYNRRRPKMKLLVLLLILRVSYQTAFFLFKSVLSASLNNTCKIDISSIPDTDIHTCEPEL